MLNLEAYIVKRKLEDHMNEFNMEQKISNIKISISYIFDYFDNYLPLEGAEVRSAEENERLNKYEKALREYSPEIRRWLVQMYDETGHQLHRTIMNYCDNVPGFFLIFEDSEFRSVSYACYAELIKKRPCLKDNTEYLFQYIKEYHAFLSKQKYEYFGFPKISEEITAWLENTYKKYNVNLSLAIEWYLDDFWDNVDMWPPGTKMKAKRPYPGHTYDYNYTKRTNLFNVNLFYSKYGNKPFLKGKKKALEILMLEKWANNIDRDACEFYESYLLELEK